MPFVDDHQNLVFVLYGQGYRAEGKEGILTTQVTVKAYDEDKKPINFSNFIRFLNRFRISNRTESLGGFS